MPQNDLAYLALIFGLFVVPRVLQRFRIPTALSSLALGALCAGLGWFVEDSVVQVLSTLGISSLFLFAGLEVDVGELRRGGRVLAQHLVVRLVLLVATALVVARAFDLDPRAASVLALALLTPSTGFILDSLGSFDLSDEARFWTKSKAIAAELLALGALFVVLQSTSLARLGLATLAMALLIFAIPVFFRVFAVRIAPWAPRSEFAFLLMVAVSCAYVTRALGVYYLVGAFLVGVAARRFRKQLPAMSSDAMLHAVESFASVFTPFYFFHAGLGIHAADLGPRALVLGGIFLVVFVPLRLLEVTAHRRLALGEPFPVALKVGQALLPTLVFTLVLASILRDQFDAPTWIFGGLIVYTVANTMLPGLLLKGPVLAWTEPRLPEEAPEPSD